MDNLYKFGKLTAREFSLISIICLLFSFACENQIANTNLEGEKIIREYRQDIYFFQIEKVGSNRYVAYIISDPQLEPYSFDKCIFLEDRNPLPISDTLNFYYGNGFNNDYRAIVFNLNDSSDPRTNGRKYELICRQECILHREKVVVKKDYSQLKINIPVDKVVQPYRMIWQNLDETTTVIPYIRTKGQPDLRSIDGMLSSIIAPEMTDEEKAVAIWKFLVDWRYPYLPFSMIDSELFDPVRRINVYGFAECYTSSKVFAVLATEAQIPARVIGLGGYHVVAEAYYEGNWHMFDSSEENFFRNDDGSIASVDDLAQNTDLIDRATITITGGTASKEFDAMPPELIDQNCFSKADLMDIYASSQASFLPPWELTDPHQILTELEPGSKAIFDFPKTNAISHSYRFSEYPLPPIFANGKLIKKIKIGSDTVNNGGEAVFGVKWSYVTLGSELKLTLDDTNIAFKAFISENMQFWLDLPIDYIDNEVIASADNIFQLTEFAIYDYFIKVDFGENNVPVNEDITGTLTTTFQFAPRVLLDIESGENTFEIFLDFPESAPPPEFEGVQIIVEWIYPIRQVLLPDDYDYINLLNPY